MAKRNITAERARQLFDYEAETGILRRKIGLRSTSHKDGSVGHLGSAGYLMVTADGYPYCVHRIAWLIMTGEWPNWIDHKDMNRLNNCWSNLRNSTPSQNAGNQLARKANRYSKGVMRKRLKWVARIKVDGRKYHLGTFDNLEDASNAYSASAKQFFGEFARS